MMKQEFEKLYGQVVPPSVYKAVEVLYMATDENKEEFVARIKKEAGVERLALSLLATADRNLEALQEELGIAIATSRDKTATLVKVQADFDTYKHVSHAEYNDLARNYDARGRQLEAADLEILKLKARLFDLLT
ncbi:MAG: hypothetical protein ACYC0N_00625 [Carboxydocellales bacterium]